MQFKVVISADIKYPGFAIIRSISARLACEIPDFESSALYKSILGKYGKPSSTDRAHSVDGVLGFSWTKDIGEKLTVTYLGPKNKARYKEKGENSILKFPDPLYEGCPKNQLPNDGNMNSFTALELSNADYRKLWVRNGVRRRIEGISKELEKTRDAAQRTDTKL